MTWPGMCRMRPRIREVVVDREGRNVWRARTWTLPDRWNEMALLLCDVWDHHWSRGAEDRVNALVPGLDRFTEAMRGWGASIIHAPSDTMERYIDHPARQRILSVPRVAPPAPIPHDDPPLPIDDRDGGSDTNEPDWHIAWTAQHPGLRIDPDRDVISDSGEEIYSWLRYRGIGRVLIAGVHTNMCVMNRPFGIKALIGWGLNPVLVRDMTDAMYNPSQAPYVRHSDGTELMVKYVEAFWCPSVHSAGISDLG